MKETPFFFNIWRNYQSLLTSLISLELNTAFGPADIQAVFDSVQGTKKHEWDDCHYGSVHFVTQLTSVADSSAKRKVLVQNYHTEFRATYSQIQYL
jgi:hypothetical protein